MSPKNQRNRRYISDVLVISRFIGLISRRCITHACEGRKTEINREKIIDFFKVSTINRRKICNLSSIKKKTIFLKFICVF